jgi:multidrug resistance efflux pump
VLRRTMYGQDITEEQAGEMVAAAQRRLDRRQKRLDRVRGLIDSGIVAKNDLDPLVDASRLRAQGIRPGGIARQPES